MKRKIKINQDAKIAYIPQSIVEDGFVDECDVYADAFTFAVVKPGASLDQVRRSLQLIIMDIEMRMEGGEQRVEAGQAEEIK